MADKTVKENLRSMAIKKALSYLNEDLDKAIPKLLKWVDSFDLAKNYEAQVDAVKKVLSDKENNWYQLVKSLWTDIDDDVRKTFIENFVINANFIGGARQKKAMAEHGCNIPWAMLLDPTSACNLQCKGCWAAEYGNKLNLSFEILDDIIKHGKELGTYFYLFSGGEPMVRKNDIIRLCEAHPDCVFTAFTNGLLIDEKFADEMLRVKNFIPAFSVEGFKEATDFRRGEGTFDSVMRAMDILKEKRLPFGASCCYTSKNIDSLSSEEYIDMLIEKGAKFAWFFHYMPVGNDAAPELLPPPEEREKMFYRIRKFRETKPIFTIDFQHDGQFTKGCIAGGRNYLHINANGDIEPCAFIHYSDSNIKEKTLLEALKSPLFMAYKNGQPFNDNMLRPCPMLENPEALRKMVKESGAHSTDMQSPENIDDLFAKCKPYANNWQEKADELWTNACKCGSCAGCDSKE